MWLPKKTQLLGRAESLLRTGAELPVDFQERLAALTRKWDLLQVSAGRGVVGHVTGNLGAAPDGEGSGAGFLFLFFFLRRPPAIRQSRLVAAPVREKRFSRRRRSGRDLPARCTLMQVDIHPLESFFSFISVTGGF